MGVPTASQCPLRFIICRLDERLIDQLHSHFTTQYTVMSVSLISSTVRKSKHNLPTTPNQGIQLPHHSLPPLARLDPLLHLHLQLLDSLSPRHTSELDHFLG